MKPFSVKKDKPEQIKYLHSLPRWCDKMEIQFKVKDLYNHKYWHYSIYFTTMSYLPKAGLSWKGLSKNKISRRWGNLPKQKKDFSTTVWKDRQSPLQPWVCPGVSDEQITQQEKCSHNDMHLSITMELQKHPAHILTQLSCLCISVLVCIMGALI